MVEPLAKPSPFSSDPRSGESVVDIDAIDVDCSALTEGVDCVLEDDSKGLICGGLDIGCNSVDGGVDEGGVFCKGESGGGVVDCCSEAFVGGHEEKRR